MQDTVKSIEDIELKEKLSAIEHKRWADWQKHMFSKCEKRADGTLIIPKWAIEQWTRQIHTPYSELSEKEKDGDREQVKRYWYLLEERHKGERKKITSEVTEMKLCFKNGMSEFCPRNDCDNGVCPLNRNLEKKEQEKLP